MFREKPEHPPAPAAEAPIPIFNFLEGLKLMWKNKNFGLLALIFALKQGTLNSFGMLLSDILTPFGFEAERLATLGLIFMVS